MAYISLKLGHFEDVYEWLLLTAQTCSLDPFIGKYLLKQLFYLGTVMDAKMVIFDSKLSHFMIEYIFVVFELVS